MFVYCCLFMCVMCCLVLFVVGREHDYINKSPSLYINFNEPAPPPSARTKIKTGDLHSSI